MQPSLYVDGNTPTAATTPTSPTTASNNASISPLSAASMAVVGAVYDELSIIAQLEPFVSLTVSLVRLYEFALLVMSTIDECSLNYE
jgi:hypothetical protein